MSFIPAEIKELVTQLPVACLMLVVVWRFLKFINERDDKWLETVRLRDEQFIAQQKENNEVLRGSAVLLDKAATIMDKVDQKLTREAYEREHGMLTRRM